MRFAISKLDDEQQIVFGFAQVAVNKGETDPLIDHQGDVVDPEDLAKAAYDFVLDSREGDVMHVGDVASHLVESMAFTIEKLEKFATTPDGFIDQGVLEVLKRAIPLGWWVGFKVDDPAAWQGVKNGTYPMFSVAGQAIREEIS